MFKRSNAAVAIAPDYSLTPDILNSRWNFDIQLVSNPFPSVAFLPTTSGANSAIFNGPFATVDSAFEGEGVQGYFSSFSIYDIFLATDDAGHPTLMLDCQTLDLIAADGDGYDDLGGISAGNGITNSNDKFWANTIAYMDQLQDPPTITQVGNVLSVGTYTNYQWYWNSTAIPDATTNTMTGSGVYSVTADLTCGCNAVSSSDHAFYITCVNDPYTNASIIIAPNLVANEGISFNGVKQPLFVGVYDVSGEMIDEFNIDAQNNKYSTSQLATGTYLIKMQNANGNVVAVKKLMKQ